MAISSDVSTKSAGTGDHDHSHDYRAMLEQVRNNFIDVTHGHDMLYSVAADKTTLWNIYLKAFPEQDRQHYTCNECRKFFERYADLVVVDEKGHLTSVMFSAAPKGEYSDHFEVLADVIESGTIENAHFTQEVKWGLAKTGPWEHFAVVPDRRFIWSHAYRTAFQEEAEKRADFHTMVRALTEYTAEHLNTAMVILESDSLYRGEAVIGPARWLQKVIADQNTTKNAKLRHNLLWRAVATAPAGFAKPRGNMIGTLLDDIKDGLPLDDIRARFKAKMDPLVHRRPQSDPGAGNIKQGEKIVAALGLEPALKRRFARFDEVLKIWYPRTPLGGTKEGVFGHLTPKEAKKAEDALLQLPSKKMTIEKFLATVLPVAEAIEVNIKPNMTFGALVTAVDPSAPKLFQWDNPVSWYVYYNPSPASQWGLRANSFVKVTAITKGPTEWGADLPQHGQRILFLLEGCRDGGYRSAGLGLFPELLRNDLHEVRKTIEAYSKSRTLEGYDNASACGVVYAKATGGSVFVRVKTGSAVQMIELDRWD